MLTVKDNEGFAAAIKSNVSMICVEGNLAKGIGKMKAVGPVSWAIALAALTAAVALAILAIHAAAVTAPVGGVGGAVPSFGALPSFGIAASVLGFHAATVAIGISVAAGGVGILTTLREKYAIVEKSENRVVLKRKD